MASFVELNSDNIVLRVVEVSDAVITDDSNIMQESLGISFLKSIFGTDTNWIQTFSDGQRKNLAGENFTYDSVNDAFIPPKPYESWILNTTSFRWEAPVEYPDDGNHYNWNESAQTWDLI
mgnify:CR=1 FL=1